MATLVALAVVTGFTAMLFEVAYTRLLVLVLGSSVHSFALMLAALLTGITLGSYLIGRLLDAGLCPARSLEWVLAGMGGSVLVSLPLTLMVPTLYLRARGLGDGSWAIHHLFGLGLCFLFLLGPGVCMGAYVPLLATLVTRGSSSVGAWTGRIYSASTTGNILGSLLTGLWFIPSFGAERCFKVGILANLGSALVAWLAGWRTRYSRPSARSRLLPAFVGCVIALLLITPPWDTVYLTTGFYRLRGETPESANRGRTQIFYQEDELAAVSVDDWGGGRRSLRINGKADASNYGDLMTQKLISHLPLLLHRKPERVLLVGVGSGISAGSALLHPIRILDAVEISPAVLAASRFFASDHGGYDRDPRTNVVCSDAREFVQLRPLAAPRYDVIISAPTNFWISGMSNLASVEWFRLLRSNLAPDGIVGQWIHGYDIDAQVLAIVLRTFLASFRYVRLAVSGVDLVLTASNLPFEAHGDALSRNVRIPAVHRDLEGIGIRSLFTLIGLFTVSEHDFPDFVGPGPVNTDDFPIVEQLAPRAFLRGSTVKIPEVRYKLESRNSVVGRFTRRCPPTTADLRDFIAFHKKSSNVRVVRHYLQELLRIEPDDAWGREELDRLDRSP